MAEKSAKPAPPPPKPAAVPRPPTKLVLDSVNRPLGKRGKGK